MKGWFYLLCALNVTYFLWQFHVGKADWSGSESDSRVYSTSIVLLEEYRAAKRAAEIDWLVERMIHDWQLASIDASLERLRDPIDHWSDLLRKTSTVPKAYAFRIERSCFMVGPFVDEQALRLWLKANALQSRGLSQRDTAVTKDYQVFYPAAKTPEQSKRDKAMLESKGLQGTWLINSGDAKGGLSLGVFSDSQRALNFKNQLMERGIQAAMLPRTETKTQFFATVMLDRRQQQRFKQDDVRINRCTGSH